LEGASTGDIRSNVSDEILEGDNSWCGYSSDSDLEDDPPESQGADGAGINAVDKASSSVYSLDLLQVSPDQIRQSLVPKSNADSFNLHHQLEDSSVTITSHSAESNNEK
jgi:hypothetical protein